MAARYIYTIPGGYQITDTGDGIEYDLLSDGMFVQFMDDDGELQAIRILCYLDYVFKRETLIRESYAGRSVNSDDVTGVSVSQFVVIVMNELHDRQHVVMTRQAEEMKRVTLAHMQGVEAEETEIEDVYAALANKPRNMLNLEYIDEPGGENAAAPSAPAPDFSEFGDNVMAFPGIDPTTKH